VQTRTEKLADIDLLDDRAEWGEAARMRLEPSFRGDGLEAGGIS
jgi:hypothetical protein